MMLNSYAIGFLILTGLLTGDFCLAQGDFNNERANLLVEKHKKINVLKRTMPGYRIQIYFGDQRQQAFILKSAFQTVYPETPAYVVYQQPHFKVRVGDFKTRLEAMGFLIKMEGAFEQAFIVQDEVKLPEL